MSAAAAKYYAEVVVTEDQQDPFKVTHKRAHPDFYNYRVELNSSDETDAEFNDVGDRVEKYKVSDHSDSFDSDSSVATLYDEDGHPWLCRPLTSLYVATPPISEYDSEEENDELVPLTDDEEDIQHPLPPPQRSSTPVPKAIPFPLWHKCQDFAAHVRSAMAVQLMNFINNPAGAKMQVRFNTGKLE